MCEHLCQLATLEDLTVGDVVVPVNVENGTEAAFVKTFKKLEMIAVGDPGLRESYRSALANDDFYC